MALAEQESIYLVKTRSDELQPVSLYYLPFRLEKASRIETPELEERGKQIQSSLPPELDNVGL